VWSENNPKVGKAINIKLSSTNISLADIMMEKLLNELRRYVETEASKSRQEAVSSRLLVNFHFLLEPKGVILKAKE
jgi:hypothetical protein